MKSSLKIKVVLILVYLFLLYVSDTIINDRKSSEIGKILKNSTNNLIVYDQTFRYYQRSISDLVYENTLQIDKLKDILKRAGEIDDEVEISKLKEKLRSLLKDEYTIVKKFNLSQYRFVLPDGKIFFKVDNDDIDDRRETLSDENSFKYVKRNRSIFRGFERDKNSLSFKNVYPIFDDSNRLIGVLYVSFPSYFLQKYLTTVGDLHSHVLIKKSIFTEQVWRKKSLKFPYVQSAEDSKFMIAITKNHPISRCVIANKKKLKNIKKKILKNIEKNRPFSLYRVVDEEITVVSFLPLKESFTDQIVAWIVSYKKDFQIVYIKKRVIFLETVLSIIFGIALYFLYLVIMQKEILKQKVNDEIEKNRIKDEHMMQQSRLAQMGEMISMIAHQWRQPLSAISASSIALNMRAKLGKTDKETIIKLTDKISQYAQHLSMTIDDFRDFFKPNKNKQNVTYSELIDSVVGIVEISLRNKNIKLIKELNSDVVFKTYSNEIKQVILNLVKNAEDALLEREVKDPVIKLVTYKNILYVEDNAGGIDEEIMDKIFNPYFSTKTKKDGTGLGLYMSKIIIEDHCEGKLRVENGRSGARFIIEL